MIPEISVVIPCYNHAHLLGEALDSLRRQELSDWEAVVVDDCSTSGNVLAVVEAFADCRVRTLRHPANHGLAAARNTGVREARTDLLMLLDADDRLAAPFLRRAVECFADPAVGFVYSDILLFGETSAIWRFGPFTPAEIGCRQPLCGCSAFRREAWAAAGGFCESPELRIGNEDWDFWMGVVANGFRGSHLADPLYEYRQTVESMSRVLMPGLYRTHEFIGVRHRRFLEENGVLETFLRYGYEKSSLAEMARGEYAAAISLALRASQLGSNDPKIRRLTSLGRLPAWALHPYLRILSLLVEMKGRLPSRAVRKYLRAIFR